MQIKMTYFQQVTKLMDRLESICSISQTYVLESANPFKWPVCP